MDIAAIRVDLRATARVSFLFFVWAFTATGLVRLVPNQTTRWLDANRRKAVLAFATSHTVHLGFILTLAASMGWAEFIHTFTWVTVVVGGAGFLLIWGLAWKALITRTSAIARDSRFEAFAY